MSAMTIGVGCMGAASPQRLWSRDYFLAFIVLVGAQLVFVTLMAYMALYALNRFSVNDAAAGFAASSFVLGAAVARLVVGKYLDFIGRKRALLLALTLYALCSLVYPMIDHYGVLIAIRIMQGTGFGVTSTTVATAVIDMIPLGRRWAVSSFLDSLFGVFFFVKPRWLLPLRCGRGGRSKPVPGCGSRGCNVVVGGCKTRQCIRLQPSALGPGWQRPAGDTFRFSGWQRTFRLRHYPNTLRYVPSTG